MFRDEANTTNVRWSTLPPSPAVNEKLRKEFDPERNELFFARHVILVEGDTEKLALPEYATRLSVDFNRAGCSVIEVGGKRSLKLFIDVIRSFGIALTVVFDQDSSDFSKAQKAEEEAYNAEIRSLDGKAIQVIESVPDYEGELRGGGRGNRLSRAVPEARRV